MGILKEGFLAYSSPVMLISRKLTKDKRVVTDFRHLNVRIAKNNLAYPLVRDTFLVLGNSKCEVLSVLDLKDAFHSLRLSENSRKYCEYSHILAAHPIFVPENANGVKHFTIHMAVLYQCYFGLSSKQKRTVKQSWITLYFSLHQRSPI